MEFMKALSRRVPALAHREQCESAGVVWLDQADFLVRDAGRPTTPDPPY
jgi:hypothetical protein